MSAEREDEEGSSLQGQEGMGKDLMEEKKANEMDGAFNVIRMRAGRRKITSLGA